MEAAAVRAVAARAAGVVWREAEHRATVRWRSLEFKPPRHALGVDRAVTKLAPSAQAARRRRTRA
jgi:hypothetical protein